jgi:hypothetical protein
MFRIAKAEIGRLTQGVLFSCAFADRYSSCPVTGLVITARCDFAQDKYPVVNYVPVVPFSAWLRADGFDIIKDRCVKQVEAEIKKLLEDWGIAESVLLANTLRQVIESYLLQLDARQRKKLEQRGLKVVERWELLESSADGQHVKLASQFGSIIEAVVKDLLGYKLSGHYFLPAVTPSEGDDAHVALLREASYLPRVLSIELSNGLVSESPLFVANPHWSRWIRLDSPDDMAMPIGLVPSPYIEHLLQSFGMLFGRIGIVDAPKSLVAAMCEIAKEGAA